MPKGATICKGDTRSDGQRTGMIKRASRQANTTTNCCFHATPLHFREEAISAQPPELITPKGITSSYECIELASTNTCSRVARASYTTASFCVLPCPARGTETLSARAATAGSRPASLAFAKDPTARLSFPSPEFNSPRSTCPTAPPFPSRKASPTASRPASSSPGDIISVPAAICRYKGAAVAETLRRLPLLELSPLSAGPAACAPHSKAAAAA